MSELRPGVLLLASPVLLDPNFADTVVLLLDVDDDGALGVVLNRPSALPVAEVLEQWGDVVAEPEVLFQGGPVSTDGALAVALLSSPDASPVGFREVTGTLGLLDLDTPVELLRGSLDALRIFAGYAGWGAAQLAGGDRRGQLVRRPGPRARRLPRGPDRPLARGDAAPARRARLALDQAGGSGAELSGSRGLLRSHLDHRRSVPEVRLPPMTQTGFGSTAVDTDVRHEERTVPTDEGDHERFSHFVDKHKLTEAMVMGTPVVALCGKVWVPSRAPEKYPVCPTCQEIWDQLKPGGNGDDGGAGGSGPGGSGE